MKLISDGLSKFALLNNSNNNTRKAFQTRILCLSIIITLVLTDLIQIIAAHDSSALHLSERRREKRKTSFNGRRHKKRCEKITTPLCMDIGYNLTDVSLSPSNVFEHSEITKTLNDFSYAIDLGCSEDLKLLVCPIYLPVCISSYHKFMPPCRHICESAKQGCEPVLRKYNVSWPETLECEDYPVYSGDNQMCLHFNRSMQATTSTRKKESLFQEPNHFKNSNKPILPVSTVSNVLELPNSSTQEQCLCQCQQPLIEINYKDPLFNKVNIGKSSNCVMSCRPPYLSEEDLKSIQFWITTLSILCFSVTSITIGTFLIDENRFKYPERSILFFSICYLFVSLGFLIRVAAGHEAVACGWKSDRALYRTTVPFLCGLVYLLIYFFSMAGAIWWLILSATWFLASGLKWSSEAISNISQWFHLIAWIFPSVKVMAIFAFSMVDGDPVAGICFVGSQNTKNLNYSIIIPLLFYLGFGCLFLIFGFFDLCLIRVSIKKAKKATSRFDKLIGRIGIFSIFHVFFSSVMLASFIYEQRHRDSWVDAHNCKKSLSGQPCFNKEDFIPSVYIFIFKYSSMILIGISSGIWIFSQKTLLSWKKFYEQSSNFFCKSKKFLIWFKPDKNRTKMQKNEKETNTLTNIKDFADVSNSEANFLVNPKRRKQTSLICSDQLSSHEDLIVVCDHNDSCSRKTSSHRQTSKCELENKQPTHAKSYACYSDASFSAETKCNCPFISSQNKEHFQKCFVDFDNTQHFHRKQNCCSRTNVQNSNPQCAYKYEFQRQLVHNKKVKFSKSVHETSRSSYISKQTNVC